MGCLYLAVLFCFVPGEENRPQLSWVARCESTSWLVGNPRRHLPLLWLTEAGRYSVLWSASSVVLTQQLEALSQLHLSSGPESQQERRCLSPRLETVTSLGVFFLFAPGSSHNPCHLFF